MSLRSSGAIRPYWCRIKSACRVVLVPIHPGHLLGIQGSPAFGQAISIGAAGRVPGFEGTGLISEIGHNVDSSLGLSLGLRVDFFPSASVWADEVIVA